MTQLTKIENEHFQIVQVQPGVFAAIHRHGGWAISNAGFIDLGEECLVFDTFMTSRAAEKLRAVINDLLGKPVRYIINSHYHNDHIWGNQAFEGSVDIVSSAETRNLILTEGKEEIAYYSQNAAVELEKQKKKLAETVDRVARRGLEMWVAYCEGLVACLPTFQLRVPNLVFQESMELHGSENHVILRNYKNAHTGSDTILWMPDRGVMFMSDLLFVKSHPFLAEGSPDALLSVLDEVAEMPVNSLVPGHGPVGGKEDVLLLRDYILSCQKTASELVEKRVPIEKITEQSIPEPFANWDLPNFYHINLRHLYQQMSGT